MTAVQTLGFIEKPASLMGDGEVLRIGMPGGPQWRGAGVDYGTAVGRFMRYLDCTNGDEVAVRDGLIRILLELLRTGTAPRILGKAIARLRGSAWCDSAPLRDALLWSELERKGWCIAYDEPYHRAIRLAAFRALVQAGDEGEVLT